MTGTPSANAQVDCNGDGTTLAPGAGVPNIDTAQNAVACVQEFASVAISKTLPFWVAAITVVLALGLVVRLTFVIKRWGMGLGRVGTRSGM